MTADSDNELGIERIEYHLERPNFRICELQIGPSEQIPWHIHTDVQDTFYVLQGTVRLFMRDPKENITLERGDTYAMAPKRPHLVTNAGDESAVFILLQDGKYDVVPLT